MSIKHNHQSLEAAARCHTLGHHVAEGTAEQLGLPLDLTTETRRIIETLLPRFISKYPQANEDASLAVQGYEESLSRRRMLNTVKEGESYYDRFQAEVTLIGAVLVAAQDCLAEGPIEVTNIVPTMDLSFLPDSHVLKSAVMGNPDNVTVFRVVSRWDDDRRALLDYSAILTWARVHSVHAKFGSLAVQPVVVGSVGNDGCYEMPLTRRWRDRSTGKYAWQASYTDDAGKSRRLGSGWEKQAVARDDLDNWIRHLSDCEADALAAVFPLPVIFTPSAQMVRHAEDFLEAAHTQNTRNTRGCLFPNECPMYRHCWEG